MCLALSSAQCLPGPHTNVCSWRPTGTRGQGSHTAHHISLLTSSRKPQLPTPPHAYSPKCVSQVGFSEPRALYPTVTNTPAWMPRDPMSVRDTARIQTDRLERKDAPDSFSSPPPRPSTRPALLEESLLQRPAITGNLPLPHTGLWGAGGSRKSTSFPHRAFSTRRSSALLQSRADTRPHRSPRKGLCIRVTVFTTRVFTCDYLLRLSPQLACTPQ